MKGYRIILTLTLTLIFPIVGFSQTILASHEFEAKNANSVTINGKFCDVYIKNGSNVYFKGVIEGSGDERDYEITSEMRGSDLYIKVIKNDRSWDRISRSRLELTVPDNVNIKVANSSGEIYARRITADKIDIGTTSGDIEMVEMNAELKVSSTSGDINLDDVSGDVSVVSTSGNQEVEGIKGAIDMRSTSGDIIVAEFDGNVKAESTSGDINIMEGRGILKLRATSGDIEGSGITIIGDVEFRTSSGDIEIDFTNSLDEISFDLQTSSGNLNVGSRRSDKELYIKRGGYWVIGVTTSGNQQFDD